VSSGQFVQISPTVLIFYACGIPALVFLSIFCSLGDHVRSFLREASPLLHGHGMPRLYIAAFFTPPLPPSPLAP
jgi:hypothetical protein